MLKDHYHEYHQVYGQQSQNENEDAALDIENIPRVLQHCYGRRRRTRTTDEHLDELELYYRRCGNMDVVPENILEWWKCNQDTFPVLSLMARDYLAVPGKNKKTKRRKKSQLIRNSFVGTSVPVERIFSSAKHTIPAVRSSLKPDTIRFCMMEKHRLKHTIASCPDDFEVDN